MALALGALACGQVHEPLDPQDVQQPVSGGGFCLFVDAEFRAALAELREEEPACVEDADCVHMSDSIRCEGVADVSGCGLAVHREMAAELDLEALSADICEPLPKQGTSCTLQPGCPRHGPPVCLAGECVLAALDPEGP